MCTNFAPKPEYNSNTDVFLKVLKISSKLEEFFLAYNLTLIVRIGYVQNVAQALDSELQINRFMLDCGNPYFINCILRFSYKTKLITGLITKNRF